MLNSFTMWDGGKQVSAYNNPGPSGSFIGGVGGGSAGRNRRALLSLLSMGMLVTAGIMLAQYQGGAGTSLILSVPGAEAVMGTLYHTSTNSNDTNTVPVKSSGDGVSGEQQRVLIVTEEADSLMQEGKVQPVDEPATYVPDASKWPWRAIPEVTASRVVSSKKALARTPHLVVGIPTVKRQDATYVLDTLYSLLITLSEEEKELVLLVVYVGDLDPAVANQTVQEIRGRFGKEIESGILEIIRAPAIESYPTLSNLKQNYNDDPERVYWRSKQVLDFALLTAYCKDRAPGYMQLEDDIRAAAHWVARTLARITSINDKQPEWVRIDFSILGFIGKVFPSQILGEVVDYYTENYVEAPIDWLLLSLTEDRPHLEFSCKESLFQHVGHRSSLAGKVQLLKDETFADDSDGEKIPAGGAKRRYHPKPPHRG